jgi:hypothetical protein
MSAIDPRLRYFFLLLVLLATGTQQAAPLNSDRIRERFGNYGVEIIRADSSTRITNLYSESDGNRICRTLAMVRFRTPVPDVLRREHDAITAGGSIGEVFRNAGWIISKTNLTRAVIDQSWVDIDIAALMNVDPAESLASAVYEFTVRRGEHVYTYATITEIYHPDFISLRTRN